MWKLTITRTHDIVLHDGQVLKNLEDKMVFKACDLMSLTRIIDLTSTYGTDGVYTFLIEWEGEEK